VNSNLHYTATHASLTLDVQKKKKKQFKFLNKVPRLYIIYIVHI